MNLILQALVPPALNQVRELAALTQAHEIIPLSSSAFRLTGAQPHPALAAYCRARQLDFALVPVGLSLQDFGLVAMDMDSTLITIECIDEIAAFNGLKPQVAAITAAAMRGEMDFAESLRRRVALLAGIDAAALQQVYDERLQLSPGAERLIAALRARQIKTLLVSGGFTFFTDRIKSRLGLDYAAACSLAVRDGKLTGAVLGPILDARGKADCLRKVKRETGAHRTLAIGDGANDLEMMAAADVSIAYHAKPVVSAQASFALDWVGLDGVLTLLAD